MKKTLHVLAAFFAVLAIALGLVTLSATPAAASSFRHDDYYVDWDDDDNPGRTYDTSKSWTILSNGMGWGCVVYTGDGATDECVVYAFDEGPVRDINIPETLSAPDGNTYRVVGIVTVGDIEGKDNLSSCHYGSSSGYFFPDYIFGNPSFVWTVTIPSNVRFIGKGAFNRYTGLRSITFAEGSQLQVIEAGAFANCTSLLGTDGTNTLVIPDSVTTIGAGAFTNCQSLTDVRFPAGANIAEDVLSYGASSLTNVTNAPTRLSFAEETPLATVSFSPGLEVVGGIGGGDNLYNLTTVVLPEGVKSIADYSYGYARAAFNDLPALRTINIPSSVLFIGPSAFSDCTSLSNLQGFPGNVQQIMGDAFYNCKSLTIDVVHPGELSDQYEGSGVRSITFSATGTYSSALFPWSDYVSQSDPTFDNSDINAEGFSGCTNLVAINVAGGSHDTVWSDDGVLFGHAREIGSPSGNHRLRGECLVKYPAAKSGGSYTIPASIKSVEVYAFEDCKFTEIHIPATVEDLITFSDYYEDEVLSPFTDMATSPTIYYVENSYASVQLEGWDSPIYDEWYDVMKPYYDMIDYDGPLATEAGPIVSIVYQMDGGVNNPNNPTSVVGGSSVTLLAPTRSDRIFTQWCRYLPNGTYEYIDGNVLTPLLDELVTCTVTVEPEWARPENPFRDVVTPNPPTTNGTSHYDDIMWLASTGISAGWKIKDSSGNVVAVEFRPASTVKRGDMAAFLFRLAKLAGLVTDDWQPSEETMSRFRDVSEGTSHHREIWWLAESGISTGWAIKDSSGNVVAYEFRPMNNVTRQDMAAFLHRLAEGPNATYTPTPEDEAYFSDVFAPDENGRGGTPHYYDILWLANTEVSKGWNIKDSSGNVVAHEFRGMNNVLRQDMAAFLYRMYEKGLVKYSG